MTIKENPWLGLKSYEENDRLYGRGKESDELANIVINSFHTIIYGKSGIGKTSLLRAGVFQTLRYEDFLPIYIRLEHNENAESDYYLRQIEEKINHSTAGFTVETNIAECNTLSDAFSKYTFGKSRGIELMPVFVFDQFEEIFTLNENKESETISRFFSDLSDILNDSSDRYNFRIVICLREDYLYYIERLSESIPAFKRNRYCLQNLTNEEALEVITKPCEGMVDDIVAQEILHKLSPEKTNEVNATILSLYMSQLYDKMVKSDDMTISLSLVRQFGDDIISAFYFASIERVSEKTIEYLEDHLVTTGGYRHNIPLEDAIADGVKQLEINHLKECRILNIQPHQGNILYMEYAHDVLCPIIVSNRDKRTLRKKAKRQKRIIAAWIFSILLMVGITTSFIFQNRQILKKQESMLLMQSRAVAGQAERLYQNGEYAKAVALCLKVLPEDLSNPDRPISYEAMSTLASFYYSNFETCKRIIHDDGRILSATFSPDNKYLVTTLSDGNVRMWSVGSGKLVRICKGHTGNVHKALFSPDGRYFVTCSKDSTARIWSYETGKCLITLRGHKGDVTYSIFSPDGKLIVTTSDDSTARIWNASSGKCLRILRGHTSSVIDPSFSIDGRFLVTTSSDSTTRVWDVNAGKLIKLFKGEYAPSPAKFSPDGKYLAVTNRYNIRLLDVTTFEPVKELKEPDDMAFQIEKIQFSPDGKYLNALGYASASFFWNTITEEIVLHYDDFFSEYGDASFSCDSKQFIQTIDSTAIIIDLTTGEQIKTLKGQGGYIFSAKFSPNGGYVASLDYEKVMVSALSIKERTKAKKLRYGINSSNIITSHDGNDLYGALSIYDSIYIYSITKDKVVRKLYTEESKFINSLSPDLKYVVSYTRIDTLAKVLNVENGDVISVIKGHNGRLRDVFFSPDSRYVVTTSRYDNVAIIWDALTGKKVHTLRGHTGVVNSVIFSHDMRYVITSSCDSTARIWNMSNGRLSNVLKGHMGEVNSATYSVDDRYIATTSCDSTIRMWNSTTGKLVRIFCGHEYDVTSASFSPDGKYLVSAAQGSMPKNSIRVWDVSTAQTIQILDHYQTNYVTFSKDGREIITISLWNGTIKYWHFIEPQALIDHFRKMASDYQFTPYEEIKYYLK